MRFEFRLVKVAPKPDLPSPKLEKVAELEQAIVFEDDALMIVNKPSGLAVHGGSGLSFGLIEGLRALRPNDTALNCASTGPRHQWFINDCEKAQCIKSIACAIA